MRTIILTAAIGLFISIASTQAQSLRKPVSAVYTNLGAYSTQQADVFSFNANQAALAGMEHASAGVYSERRFMLSETSVYTAAVAVPSPLGNVGVNIAYTGFKNFSENNIGLAYARSLGKKLDVGVQFNYYHYNVPAYTSDNAINFEAGILLHLSEQFNTGMHVYSPVGGRFSKTGEKLMSCYTMGLGYDASDNFFVSAELVKEEGFPVNMNAFMQYRFARLFFARAGIASASTVSFAGFGLAWNSLRLDISASYHQQLGISPGLMLIYHFRSVNQVSSLQKD